MSLASNIRFYRKRAGLTQIEMAERMGISIATLRRWEAGETSPNGTKISEIAEFLGITPEDIVSREDNAAQDKNNFPQSKQKIENNIGMLVFEGEGTRIELPPSEKGYELFNKLISNLIEKKSKSD